MLRPRYRYRRIFGVAASVAVVVVVASLWACEEWPAASGALRILLFAVGFFVPRATATGVSLRPTECSVAFMPLAAGPNRGGANWRRETCARPEPAALGRRWRRVCASGRSSQSARPPPICARRSLCLQLRFRLPGHIWRSPRGLSLSVCLTDFHPGRTRLATDPAVGYCYTFAADTMPALPPSLLQQQRADP